MIVPLLSVVDLHKHYGGIRAVDGCTLEVLPNTISGLIGPNGAGKTTLFNVITGAARPDSGAITFQGERIEGLSPDAIFHRRLYRTFQTPREFGTMSLLENLMLILERQRGEHIFGALGPERVVREQEQRGHTRALDALQFVDLYQLRNDRASTLSGGQRKLLELARALMADPALILLDEPGAGVNPVLLERIVAKIEEMAASGISFLLIEHDMDLVMRLCHPILVMSQGKLLMSGSSAEVQSDERVLSACLGVQSAASA